MKEIISVLWLANSVLKQDTSNKQVPKFTSIVLHPLQGVAPRMGRKIASITFCDRTRMMLRTLLCLTEYYIVKSDRRF